MLTQEVQTILAEACNVLATGDRPLFDGEIGGGMSERCIETPWAAGYFRGGEKLLDVGFSLASPDWLGLLVELGRHHGVTLEAADIIDPERIRARYPKDWLDDVLAVPVMLGDFRQLDLPAARYDIATCISTIEHIGFDKAADKQSSSAFERPDNAARAPLSRPLDTNEKVLGQFHSALRDGGILLISVPLGKDAAGLVEDSMGLFASQWEYGPQSWKDLSSQPGFTVLEERFFRLRDDGLWVETDGPDACMTQPRRTLPHAQGVGLLGLRKNG